MKISKHRLLYACLFLWMIFNTTLQSYIPGFNYFDEALLAFSLVYLAFNFRKECKEYCAIFFCSLLIVVIGLFSNLIWNYNNGYIVIIKDIVAFLKMPIILLAAAKVNDSHGSDIPLDVGYTLSKIIILIMIICLPISIALNTNMIYEYRRGIPSYRFVYGHPTFMVYAVVIMLAIMIAHGPVLKDYFFHCSALLLLFFSARDKAYIAIALYFLIIFVVPNMRKIKITHIILAVIAVIAVTYQKISLYLSFSWSPRMGLYTSGLSILASCFPFGSGFGTFASYLSGEYYSKLYYIYGFADRVGALVNETNYTDLSDAGLPYYYAQFGLFGFACFVIILLCLYFVIIKKYGSNPNKRRAAFLILGYLFSSLLVENVFVNESGATSMLVLFVYLGCSQTGRIENSLRKETNYEIRN